MKNRNIGLIGICLFAFCSCDSWLSVSPSNEMPVEDQFGSEQGVKHWPGPMSWSRIRIYTGKPLALDTLRIWHHCGMLQ